MPILDDLTNDFLTMLKNAVLVKLCRSSTENSSYPLDREARNSRSDELRRLVDPASEHQVSLRYARRQTPNADASYVAHAATHIVNT